MAEQKLRHNEKSAAGKLWAANQRRPVSQSARKPAGKKNAARKKDDELPTVPYATGSTLISEQIKRPARGPLCRVLHPLGQWRNERIDRPFLAIAFNFPPSLHGSASKLFNDERIRLKSSCLVSALHCQSTIDWLGLNHGKTRSRPREALGGLHDAT